MSTVASVIAACLAMVGLVVVVALTVTRPRDQQQTRRLHRERQPPARHTSGWRMALRRSSPVAVHRISTQQGYVPTAVVVTSTERNKMKTALYSVPGMSCGHCEAAVTREISALPGVDSVVVDLASKRVEVYGSELDDVAIRAAIEEAGYEAA